MTQQSCWELTALWLSPGTIWAISSLRDNTQCVVLSSGARAPYSPRLNRSIRPQSFVGAMRHYASGTLERPPHAKPLWREPSPWQTS